MSRLNKATTLPVEGAPAFKDPADRRAEAVARSMFTVVGSAVRPVLAGLCGAGRPVGAGPKMCL